MNILMMDKYLTVGGVATYLKTLSKGLMERGHNVYIMTATDSNNRKIIDEFSSYGIKFLTIPKSKNRLVTFYQFVKILYRFLNKNSVDVIHSHHRIVNFAGILVSKICSVPHLITFHVIKDDYKQLLKLWKNEQVTVPSRASKINLVEHCGLEEEKIQVIPNAISTDYDLDFQKRKALQQKMFSDPEKFYVGFIGRISYEKGVDVLLEAIPLVKKKYPDIEFRIFGDGLELPKLRERCEELGLKSNKIFQGKNYQPNELLSLIDLCVIPSRSESFCLLALECMRAKKPVIASNVGGIPEVIVHGESGLLMEPENCKVLAERIMKLYKNKDLRKKIAENGHRRFIEKFPVEKFCDDYLDTYQQLKKV